MKNSELQQDYDVFMNFHAVLHWTKFPAEKFKGISQVYFCVFFTSITYWH